jgi:hypothetical protein
MRQNPKLTRSRATRSTLRPKCPQSQQKTSKQGSAFVEVTEIPVFQARRPEVEIVAAGNGRQTAQNVEKEDILG